MATKRRAARKNREVRMQSSKQTACHLLNIAFPRRARHHRGTSSNRIPDCELTPSSFHLREALRDRPRAVSPLSGRAFPALCRERSPSRRPRQSLFLRFARCATLSSMKKKRRPGATETFSVSVDRKTKDRL